MTMDGMALGDQIAALEQSFGASSAMAVAFDGELARMREGMVATGREVASLTSGLGGDLRRAFDGLVFGGASLSDALQGLAKSMSNTVYAVALKPVQTALGGALANGMEALWGAAAPFASGAAFSAGRVTAFATGGVVQGPTHFPMRGGSGLMGEAGPEAILPLARGPDGRLGVQLQGQARPVQVVMNITTPDVQGFRRSQGQVAQAVNRMLAQGQRNA